MSTRVLLVRHGDTAAGKDGKIADANDIPISKGGRVHESELAMRLARQPVDANYASSLQRALDTAGSIVRVHGMEGTPVPDLREMSHGVWESKSRADIIK